MFDKRVISEAAKFYFEQEIVLMKQEDDFYYIVPRRGYEDDRMLVITPDMETRLCHPFGNEDAEDISEEFFILCEEQATKEELLETFIGVANEYGCYDFVGVDTPAKWQYALLKKYLHRVFKIGNILEKIADAAFYAGECRQDGDDPAELKDMCRQIKQGILSPCIW